MRFRSSFATLPLALTLSSCVSFSSDGGLSSVSEGIRPELTQKIVKISDDAQEKSATSQSHALLGKGLTVDRAVQIALLRNKGLQAAYNQLGISEAAFVQASSPPNPSISILAIGNAVDLDIERRLIGNLLALFTLPARREIAEVSWRNAQLEAIGATLKIAVDTRRQYWRAIAAKAQVAYLTQARAAAETTSELAKKLGETGALNKLDQGREHAFYAELSTQFAKGRTQQKVEKERLTRIMGLWGSDTGYALPGALPSIPRTPNQAGQIEAKAIERRVDIKMARNDLDRTAKELGLTQATRYVNAFELTAAENYTRTATDRSTLRGAEIKLEIPIFDFGEARAKAAEETYMRAVNRLAGKAVDARSEVREAYTAYRGAWDVARLYQSRVLPLRKTIQEQSHLQYNGMLADLFVLLQDARAAILSNTAAIDARRDFWIAETDLRAAMLAGSMASSDPKPSANSVGSAD